MLSSFRTKSTQVQRKITKFYIMCNNATFKNKRGEESSWKGFIWNDALTVVIDVILFYFKFVLITFVQSGLL